MRFDRVVLVGFKHSGKTAVGKVLSARLGFDFLDIDDLIEDVHAASGGKVSTVREIYKELGKSGFQELEGTAVERAAVANNAVIALGGGSPMNPSFSKDAFGNGVFVHLKTSSDILFERIRKNGFPPFFDHNDPRGSFDKLLAERLPVYESVADISADNTERSPEDTAQYILDVMEKRYAG